MGKTRLTFEELIRRIGPLPVTALISAQRPPAASKTRGVAIPRDLLDDIVARRSKKNVRFPDLVAEAERRRALARALAAKRTGLRLSQTLVAARMGTSVTVVSKLEAGGDVKLSVLQRYCAAIGQEFPPKGPSRRQVPRAA